MTNMMDADEKGKGPVENANPALCIYIVVYLVVMSFFMINIFVGFVIVTFQEKGEKDNEASILDRNKVKYKTLRYYHRRIGTLDLKPL